jgi:hypothetical protein
MVILNKGRRKFMIACPEGHVRLPTVSTVPGARQFYDSESQAEEEAHRLYEMMNKHHAAPPGDPRIHDKYRRARRN